MDTSHDSALQLKHAGLERRIEQEMSRPAPDYATIQSLKKQKLRLNLHLMKMLSPCFGSSCIFKAML